MAGLRLRDLAILGSAIVAGVAGAFTALHGRDADNAFLYRQRHPLTLRAVDVQRAVRRAPDPLVGNKGPPGEQARCRPHGSGDLRNPWTCTVTYRSRRRRPRLRVDVRDDGSYVGRYEGGGSVEGCCVGLPAGG